MFSRLKGIIARRILVNYRIDPRVAQELLPPGLKPKLQGELAIAGICLIRLERMGPEPLPPSLGAASENAAHRIAVVDDEGQGSVFIPRRDSSSWASAMAGGLVFPVQQHHARFKVADDGDNVDLEMDGAASLHVIGRTAKLWPKNSIFSSLQESSSFFRDGSIGISPRLGKAGMLKVELVTQSWEVDVFQIEELRSSFFEGFGASAEFDHALIMRNIHHEWRAVN